MAIQLLEEEPAVCKNKECENYNCFEIYYSEEVQKDETGYYVICDYCKSKIYLD